MEQKVLIVIDNESKLIHVGDPETFDEQNDGETIIEYARKGYTIATVSLEKYKEFALYEKVEVIINP